MQNLLVDIFNFENLRGICEISFYRQEKNHVKVIVKL